MSSEFVAILNDKSSGEDLNETVMSPDELSIDVLHDSFRLLIFISPESLCIFILEASVLETDTYPESVLIPKESIKLFFSFISPESDTIVPVLELMFSMVK